MLWITQPIIQEYHVEIRIDYKIKSRMNQRGVVYDLSQIMYFLAVVKYKTFTQASDELYISQSSLSKQIKALELELGHTLLLERPKKTL